MSVLGAGVARDYIPAVQHVVTGQGRLADIVECVRRATRRSTGVCQSDGNVTIVLERIQRVIQEVKS